MSKKHEAGPAQMPVDPGPPPKPKAAAAPQPRVIPEYRPLAEGGAPVGPVRLSDYPEEEKAGWHRYKVVCRIPYETTHPTVYVLAPDAKAAEKCCREHHGLEPLPEAIAAKLQTIARELPD